MKRRTLKTSLKVIGIAFLIATVAVVAIYLSSALISSASGDEIELTQPPNFNEFERWFGPAPKGNERTHQLFEATKLLLESMNQNPRDMQSAAETIPCKLTADQWQDVIGVAISYRIWQEVYLLRGEIGKLSSVASDLSRLENFLKVSLKQILDEQVKTNEKLDALQKSIDNFAQKIGLQIDELLKDSKEQIRLLNEILPLLKEIKGIVVENNVLLKGIDGKIDKLLEEPQAQPKSQPEVQEKRSPLPVRLTKKAEPKSFWAGFGALGGEKVYTNPLGVMADFAVFHTRPDILFYLEGGARRFLVGDVLAVQIFGGYGSAWFLGTGIVVNIDFLDISVSGGAQYLPNYLVGNLEPVQGFIGLNHEGEWTQLSLRFIPGLNMGQLSINGKF